MTKQEAMEELKRAAEICPTTPLAEACRMAVEALRGDGEKPDCVNCRYADRMPSVYPCSEQRYSGVPSKWEPKGVDNGKTN